MRWFFRDEDLAQGGDFGDVIRSLFEAMKSQLEYDEMRCLWIRKLRGNR